MSFLETALRARAALESRERSIPRGDLRRVEISRALDRLDAQIRLLSSRLELGVR